MKSLITLFFKRFHFIIFAYMCWHLYSAYEENSNRQNDLRQEVETAKTNLDIARKKLEQGKIFQRDLERGKNRLEEATALLKKIQGQLPTLTEDSAIFETLNTLASSLNIKDLKLNPLLEINKNWYYSKRYEIKMRGTYLQFLVFFEQLASTSRIFNVADLNLKQTNTNSKGRFQIIELTTELEVYRLNPQYDPESEVNKEFQDLKEGKKP